MTSNDFFLEITLILSHIVGIIIFLYYLNGLLEQKKQSRWIRMMVIIGASLLFLTILYIFRQSQYFLFVSIAILSVLSLALYQGKIIFRLFLVMLFEIFGAIAEIFAAIIITLFFEFELAELSKYPLYLTAVEVLTKVFLFFFVFFLIKLMKKEIRTKSVLIKGLLLSIPIFSLIVCLNLYFMVINLHGSEYIGILGVVTLTYINAVFVAIYRTMQNEANQTAEYKSANKQLELQQLHYREILKKNEEVRGLWHDMSNFQITMQYMLSENKLNQLNDYLLEIREKLDQKIEHQISGNTVVDAILNNKIKQAKEHKIKFNYSIAIPETIQMSGVDLSIIIGNLLDNAIEACRRDDRSCDEKEIFIVMKYRKGILMIDLENTVDEQTLEKAQDIYLSSKKNWRDRRIGHGMSNIRHVLSQYEGNMVNQVIDSRFKSTLIIPLPENNLMQMES